MITKVIGILIGLIIIAIVAIFESVPHFTGTIQCLEPTGDGRMMYGPYVLEYRATTESPPYYYQDGSEAPVGSHTVLFAPRGGGFYDLFSPGSARFWVEGTEEETRAMYDALTQGIPGAESGVAVTLTDGAPIYCPEALVVALNIIAKILSIAVVVNFALWVLAGKIDRPWPIAVNAVLLTVTTALWTFLFFTVGGGVAAWAPIFTFGLMAVGHFFLLIRR